MSIVSAKPQTTRHLITGILTTPECQYVFVDAPGQQAQASNTLNRRLNRRATEAARDADVALFVVEALRFGPDDHAVLEKIPPSQRIVAAVNKIDTVKHARSCCRSSTAWRRRGNSPPSCRSAPRPGETSRSC